MKNNAGFGGVERGDSVIGTVIEAHRGGVQLILDEHNETTGEKLYAYAACGLPLGETALFTVLYYNTAKQAFATSLDSILFASTNKFTTTPAGNEIPKHYCDVA